MVFAADKLTTRAFLFCITMDELVGINVCEISEAILANAAHPSVFVQALERKLQKIPQKTLLARNRVRFCIV